MSSNKKIIYITGAAVVLALIAGVFFWQKRKNESGGTATAPPAATLPAPENKSEALGGQIYEQVQNPIQKLPEANPFKVKANPFGDTKTNPYKDVYKNPFAP